MPRIFFVNWFRKSADGKFLWPGFGENSRVLKWVFERCGDQTEVTESFVGYHPAPGSLDLTGLDISRADMEELFKVDKADWQKEITLLHDHYDQFGNRLPEALREELQALEKAIKDLA